MTNWVFEVTSHVLRVEIRRLQNAKPPFYQEEEILSRAIYVKTKGGANSICMPIVWSWT